jgi:hypothetical protein
MKSSTCLWCGQPTPGPARVCDVRRFGLMRFAGWFEPARLWVRQNSKLVAKTETATTMADQDFANSGILFGNDRKREGSNDPDYKGTCDCRSPFWKAGRATYGPTGFGNAGADPGFRERLGRNYVTAARASLREFGDRIGILDRQTNSDRTF